MTNATPAALLQTHIQEGLALLRSGECQRAIEHLLKALELDPKNAGIHLLVSQVLFNLQQAEEGVTHLCTALQIDKKLIQFDELISIMRHFMTIGKYESAFKLCNSALSIDSSKADLHVTMAEILVSLGRPDRAIKAYKRALEADPKQKEFNPHIYPTYSIPNKIGILEEHLIMLEDDLEDCEEPVSINAPNSLELFYDANRLASTGNIKDAIELYRESVELDSNIPETFYSLACALEFMGKVTSNHKYRVEAAECYMVALQKKPNWHAALYRLGRLLITFDHGERSGFPDPRDVLYRALEINSKHPETLLELRDLAYQYGRTDEYMSLMQRYWVALEERANNHPIGKLGVRFVHEHLSRGVGHIASYTEEILQYVEYGWTPPFKYIVSAPDYMVANPALMHYWDDKVQVVRDPKVVKQLRKLKKDIFYDITVAHKPDGEKTLGRLIRPYQSLERIKRGLGPLIKVKEEHKQQGRKILQDLGMPHNAWFVAMHVRSNNYKGEGKGCTFDRMRNAELESYYPAVEEIVRRGGWVVRIGENTTKPMAKMKNVIDYAHTPYKSDWMDVFLCGEARFFLGACAGIMSVSQTFHVPIACANFPVTHLQHHPWDIFIPKLLRDKSGRDLTFKEIFAPPYGLGELLIPFEENGISFIDNTAEEVLDVTIEMLDRLDGVKDIYTVEDEELLRKYRSLIPPKLGISVCRVGRNFLRKYKHLLD